MLNIFYGRQSIDRDRFIFDNVKPQTILLVPDQFSLQAEKDAFAYLKTDALMDIEVLSFSRLCDRVVGETGGRRLPMIDKQGRHMMLTKIMNDSADELEIYGRYSSSSSFLEMANNMISELKQCSISADELEDISGQGSGQGSKLLSKKLQEIAFIYKGYEKAIEGHYIDTEDLASLFVRNIKDSQTVIDSVFWVYGFDVFSPKNLDALEMLIRYSAGVNVVLCYDEGRSDSALFTAVGETMNRLIKAGENVNVRAGVSRIPAAYEKGRTGELAHIEKAIYSMPPEKYSAGKETGAAEDQKSENQEAEDQEAEKSASEKRSGEDSPVQLVRASSIYAEAETAAAHVMHLVRDRGFAYRDIILICNDKGVRAESYKQAFARYGIKIFADEKRSIMTSPAATYVLSLMRIIAEGYKWEDVIKLLKTSLAGMERSEIEELEIYAGDFRINGAQWKRPFCKMADRYSEEELDHLEQLRQRAIGPVLEFHEKYKAERTVAGKVMVLYTHLSENKIPEKLEEMAKMQDERGELEKAAETMQVWNRLVGIFDQLVEILGDERISAESFFDLLESGIAAVEIGVLPPAMDGLMMGTMQRTRSGRVKSVMILGANDGLLPMDMGSAGLLSEKERSSLMDLSDKHLLKTDELRAAEERLAIYRNLSAPECELYISCAESSGSGESSRPSLIFERIRKMFPDIKVSGDIFAGSDPWKRIGSKKSTMIHLAQEMKAAESMDDVWQGVLGWYEKNMPDELERINKGLKYDGRIDAVEGEYVRRLYDRRLWDKNAAGGTMDMEHEIRLSPTRLESFAGCPFAHFRRYGLRARERRVYEVGGIEMGDVHHRCLESFSRKMNDGARGALTDPDSPWMNITEDECKSMVSDIMNGIADDYKDGLLHESKADEYRLARMKKVCEESAWMLTGQMRKGAVEGMLCEVQFGSGRRFAPVTVETDNGTVLIEGKIDRLDILPRNMAKVIDYKSGNMKFEENEVRAGWQIQLMLYMRAARENGYEPVGSFYYILKDPVVDKAELSKGIEKALSNQFRLEGVVKAEEQVLDSIDNGMGRYSDVFVAGKSMKKPEEFEELTEIVDEKINDMCARLMAGDIEIKPKRSYKGTSFNAQRSSVSKSACVYCPYSGICKFDTRFEGCSYEYI